MKKTLLNGLFFTVLSLFSSAQITTPVIKAAFGVDADLKSNFYNNFVISGNDDWFSLGYPGTGKAVIDTTGAAALVAAYMADVAPYPVRMTPIYRGMSVPQYSVINNRLWLDAHWVRDHHGNDSTVFSAGSNKNGDSPASWNSPVTQAIPDKNDILDAMLHYRREGPNNTDSLWMFTALSLDNTTGNRYFDFELYQTDIYFDRPTRKWYGYGPDMGHTSWQFDAAGNVIKAGDIIFSAKFQNSTLTELEARIWVASTTLSITPTQFNWGGVYDGAYNGAPFGYASIVPNTSGPYYSGLGCGANNWAGPFQLVRQDNSVVPNYSKDQFMEFSVNLSKLGVDPVNLFGSNFCGSPFNRFVVKTRTSESFTSELKDFIAPLTLFLAPRADVATEVPIFCADTATSFITVQNPHPTSIYTWSTPDGNIISPTTGTTIQVNTPGTYLVTQQLGAGCNAYAVDSAIVVRDELCSVLPGRFNAFSATYSETDKNTRLKWSVFNNDFIDHFEIERSIDGSRFESAGIVQPDIYFVNEASYNYTDPVFNLNPIYIDYRIKMISHDGSQSYTRIIRIYTKQDFSDNITISPNPVRDRFQMIIHSISDEPARIIFYDISGRQVKLMNEQIRKGINIFSVERSMQWQPGTYTAAVQLGEKTVYTRFVVLK